MKTRGWMAMAAMLLATGCRSVAPMADNPAAVSEAAEAVAEAHYVAREVSAVVEGIGTTGQVRVARDSVVWVALYRVVELGRAMATRDSLWVSVPMAGRYFAGDYADVSRLAKRSVTFADVQRMAMEADGEAQIAALASELGIGLSVRLGAVEPRQQLSFPFRKKGGTQ